MGSRLRAVVVAVSVLTATLILAPPVDAAYVYACTGDNDNFHAYIHQIGSLHIDYVTGTIASVKDVDACTTGTAGASLVMTANLQGWAFVQLGYGSLAANDAIDWVYTPSETSGGVVVHPSGSHTKPVLGHAYKQTIQWNGSVWYYRTTDTTLGTLAWDVNGSTNTRTYGYETWEGFEIWDTNSQFGGAGTSIYLGDSGFRFVGASTVSYITGAGSTTCCGIHRSWQHYGVVNVSGNHTQVWAYTASH